ncbi:hypothetical protein ACHHYP_03833 [Achlya hypogyna]|uniref:RING-type domain-containing protein n=1 Tax=Achlya hypogyna TaxID=1202772 RepID=A0A1V9Z2V8_ACHHY|nr:hypothetical protein ACHHYP_03833 [Achlya hypogyna]
MNVVSPASGPFVIYTLIVSCPSTKTWWVLQKRYSEFLVFRRALAALAKRYAGSADVAAVLTTIATTDFPKKHPFKPIHNATKIQERTDLFKKYTTMLVALRQACVVRALQAENKDGLNAVHDLVVDFLSIPEALWKDDIRRTIALVSPSSSMEEETSSRPEDACAICLCECEDSETLLKMPCQHVFHEECVVRWLEKTPHCPLCRQSATEGHVL